MSRSPNKRAEDNFDGPPLLQAPPAPKHSDRPLEQRWEKPGDVDTNRALRLWLRDDWAPRMHAEARVQRSQLMGRYYSDEDY